MTAPRKTFLSRTTFKAAAHVVVAAAAAAEEEKMTKRFNETEVKPF